MALHSAAHALDEGRNEGDVSLQRERDINGDVEVA